MSQNPSSVVDISKVSSKDLINPAVDPSLHDNLQSIKSNEHINKSGYVRPKIDPTLLLREMNDSMRPNQTAYEPFVKLLSDDGDGLSDDGQDPTEDELALLQSLDLSIKTDRAEGEKTLIEHMNAQPLKEEPQRQFPTDRWRRVLPDGHVIKKIIERGYPTHSGKHIVHLADEITGEQYERVVYPPRSIGITTESILAQTAQTESHIDGDDANNTQGLDSTSTNPNQGNDGIHENNEEALRMQLQAGRPGALTRAYGLLSIRVYDLARFVKKNGSNDQDDTANGGGDSEDDDDDNGDTGASSSLLNQAIDAALVGDPQSIDESNGLDDDGDGDYAPNTPETNPLYGEDLPYLVFSSMHEEVSVLLGHAQSFRGLEVAISTMDVGERAIILCSNKYGGKMEHLGEIISAIPTPHTTAAKTTPGSVTTITKMIHDHYTFKANPHQKDLTRVNPTDHSQLFFELTKPRGIITNMMYQHIWLGLQAHRHAMLTQMDSIAKAAQTSLPCRPYASMQLPFAGYAHTMAAIPMDIITVKVEESTSAVSTSQRGKHKTSDVIDPQSINMKRISDELNHTPEHPLLTIPNDQAHEYFLTCFNNYHDQPNTAQSASTNTTGSDTINQKPQQSHQNHQSCPHFHQLKTLPKHYILEFDFTLTRFEKEKNIHMMEREDKLAFTTQRRDLSKALLGSWGKGQSSASQLHRALSLLEDDAVSEQQLTSSQQDYTISQKNKVLPKLGTHERRHLQQTIGTNLAICCNLLERWNDTLLLANLVLGKLNDVGNIKMTYARSKAYRGKRDYQRAMGDLQQCQELLTNQLDAKNTINISTSPPPSSMDAATHASLTGMLHRVENDIKQLRALVIKEETKTHQKMKGFLLTGKKGKSGGALSAGPSLYDDKPDKGATRNSKHGNGTNDLSKLRGNNSWCNGYWQAALLVKHLCAQNINRMVNDCLDQWWRPQKKYKGK